MTQCSALAHRSERWADGRKHTQQSGREATRDPSQEPTFRVQLRDRSLKEPWIKLKVTNGTTRAVALPEAYRSALTG